MPKANSSCFVWSQVLSERPLPAAPEETPPPGLRAIIEAALSGQLPIRGGAAPRVNRPIRIGKWVLPELPLSPRAKTMVVAAAAAALAIPTSLPFAYFALDFGKEGAAILSSLLSTVGLAFSLASLRLLPQLQRAYGWYAVHAMFAGLGLMATLAMSTVMFADQRKFARGYIIRAPPPRPPPPTPTPPLHRTTHGPPPADSSHPPTHSPLSTRHHNRHRHRHRHRHRRRVLVRQRDGRDAARVRARLLRRLPDVAARRAAAVGARRLAERLQVAPVVRADTLLPRVRPHQARRGAGGSSPPLGRSLSRLPHSPHVAQPSQHPSALPVFSFIALALRPRAHTSLGPSDPRTLGPSDPLPLQVGEAFVGLSLLAPYDESLARGLGNETGAWVRKVSPLRKPEGGWQFADPTRYPVADPVYGDRKSYERRLNASRAEANQTTTATGGGGGEGGGSEPGGGSRNRTDSKSKQQTKPIRKGKQHRCTVVTRSFTG